MGMLRFRLPSSGSAAVSPAFGTWTHNQSVRRPLPTSDSTALASQAYTPDAADHAGDGSSMHVQFVSDALTTGTVFSVGNNIQIVLQGLEPNTGCNQFLEWEVKVVSNDGATLRQTLLRMRDNTEFTASLLSRAENEAGGSTVQNAYTTVSGDRLVVEIGCGGSPGGGGGTQGHNATLRFGSDGAGGDLALNDSQSGTTLNPWIEIETTEAATELVIADGAQAQTADGVTLTVDLVVADAAQAQAGDNVSLEVDLTIDNAAEEQAAENVVLNFPVDLVVADGAQEQSADNVTLDFSVIDEEHYIPIGPDSDFAYILSWVSESGAALLAETNLIIADAEQAQTAENVSLEVDLSIADGAQAQTAENVVLDVAVDLVIQGADQTQTAGNLDLEVFLVIEDAVQAQVADNLSLAGGTDLVIQDATQAQVSDSLNLEVSLLIDDAQQAQSAEEVSLTPDLIVQDAVQAQSAEELTLVVDLVVQDAEQAQSADSLTLTVDLVIHDAAQGQTSDEVVLGMPVDLVIQNSAQTQTSTNVTLTLPGAEETGRLFLDLNTLHLIMRLR